MESLYKLQNGSDIRGIASEGIAGENVNLTPNIAKTLAKAFAYYLINDLYYKDMKIAVGYDSRISSNILEEAVVEGLSSSGAKVIRTGLSSTPSMFMSTVLIGTNAAVMITASHLPFNRNGIKFFLPNGGLGHDEIKRILDIASRNLEIDGNGLITSYDLLNDYSNYLVKFIRNKTGMEFPLAGLKICVDAGNGAGGFYAHKVLDVLGADTSSSQFLNPDGMFPNHIPNPENKEAMLSISNRVLETKSDFGIIFDTDVDRAACVDKYGKEINRNRLIALISKILLEEKPGTIVTDSVTSSGLTTFITDLGGVHHRFKRGYKNVIDESIRLNNEGTYSPLAIETSGHAALKENYFLDDGAYLITRILVKLASLNKEGKELGSEIASLKEPVEAVELRFGFIDNDNFKDVGIKILEYVRNYAVINGWDEVKPNYEGIRISFKNGWFLLRLSLHDPIMPLNIESEVHGECKIIAKELYKCLKETSGLNLDPIKNYLK